VLLFVGLCSSVRPDCGIAIGPRDEGRAAKRETTASGRRLLGYLNRA
jgi:hypothetical protein